MLRLRRKVQQPPALLAPPYLGRRATDHGETVTDFARSGMHRCHSLVRLSSWFVRLCVKSGHFVTSGHVWRIGGIRAQPDPGAHPGWSRRRAACWPHGRTSAETDRRRHRGRQGAAGQSRYWCDPNRASPRGLPGDALSVYPRRTNREYPQSLRRRSAILPSGAVNEALPGSMAQVDPFPTFGPAILLYNATREQTYAARSF
jgi:hypothetical protein